MQSLVFSGLSAGDFKNLLAETVTQAVRTEVELILSKSTSRPKEILTRNETAKILGVTLATLNLWEKAGILSPFRIGTRVRYKYEDVQNALSSRIKRAA